MNTNASVNIAVTNASAIPAAYVLPSRSPTLSGFISHIAEPVKFKLRLWAKRARYRVALRYGARYTAHTTNPIPANVKNFRSFDRKTRDLGKNHWEITFPVDVEVENERVEKDQRWVFRFILKLIAFVSVWACTIVLGFMLDMYPDQTYLQVIFIVCVTLATTLAVRVVVSVSFHLISWLDHFTEAYFYTSSVFQGRHLLTWVLSSACWILIALHVNAVFPSEVFSADFLSVYEKIAVCFFITGLSYALFRIAFLTVIDSLTSKKFRKRVNRMLLEEYFIRRLCEFNGAKASFPTPNPFGTAWNDGKLKSLGLFQGKVEYIEKRDFIVPLNKTRSNAPVMNLYSWKHDPASELVIADPEELAVLSEYLFNNLDADNDAHVYFSDWMRHFPDFISTAKAFSTLLAPEITPDEVVGMYVSEKRLTRALEEFFEKRANLRTALRNWKSNMNILFRTFRVAFWFPMLLVLLAIWDMDTQAFLATAGVLVLSSTFAFGSTIAEFVQSMVFVLVTRPFMVGDWISFQDYTPVSFAPGTRFMVEEVTMAYTIFRSVTNRVLHIRNSKLTGMVFNNYMHKPATGFVTITTTIDINTPRAVLESFKAALQKYCYSCEKLRNEYTLFLSPLADGNSMTVNVWIQCASLWSSPRVIWRCEADLNEFMWAEFQRLGIRYFSESLRITKDNNFTMN